jgi:response regulator NasT
MASRAINILLVDDSDARAEALERALQDCGFTNVLRSRRATDVLEQVRQSNPDVILIDVESPTRDTLEQLTLIRDKQPRPVVLFTQDQTVQTIQAAIHSGVSAYVTAGISAEQVRPAIEVAIATFKQHQALRDELEQARADLTDRKAVERAKAILMSRHNLNDEQAYHLMRRFAMSRKRRLADVARDLIELAELTAGNPAPPLNL